MVASEADLRRTVLEYLALGQAQGYWLVLDLRAPNQRAPGKEGTTTTPGMPDIILLVTNPKRPWPSLGVVGIELKSQRGRLREAQLAMSEAWQYYGPWVTARSLAAVIEGLREAGVQCPDLELQ